MLTKAELKSIITNNFNDVRISSIVLFINELIEREKYGGGINQYRIFDTKTNSFITSLNQFITAIDENSLSMRYLYGSEKMTGDRMHPMVATIGNFVVQLNEYSEEDQEYFKTYGKATKINFLLNYLADGDTVLPLKIFEVRLS